MAMLMARPSEAEITDVYSAQPLGQPRKEQGKMSNRRLGLLLTFFGTLFVPPVQAFWDPPYVTPAHPTTNDAVSINARLGVCDAFYHDPDYPKIATGGGNIRIVSIGFHNQPGDDACNLPTTLNTYQIGNFPPGSYTVTYDLYYMDFFGAYQYLNLGMVQFDVAAFPATTESAPTLNLFAISALALALAALGIIGMSKRKGAIPRCSLQSIDR
jgi:hypothetical protein